MFALISRILNLSGRYKSRIQAAFLCAFVESILSKMPIFMAFIVLAGFADNTLTGKTCLFVGLGLLAVVVVQTVVHYLSDRLQSAAGFTAVFLEVISSCFAVVLVTIFHYNNYNNGNNN